MPNPVTIYAEVGATANTSRGSVNNTLSVYPRELIPFSFLNIAAGDNADPLLATPVAGQFCGMSTIPAGVFAQRNGRVVGISVNMSAAASGTNAVFGIYKNGTIINASAVVILTAGGAVKNTTTFPTTYTFVAGDILDVRVRVGSGWNVLTTDASILVEVEFFS
jgi:hypothetical protein